MPDRYAWLIYDRAGAERNRDYIRYHHELGHKLGIRFETIVLPDRPGIAGVPCDRSDAVWSDIADLSGSSRPDFAIVRTIRPSVNRELERRGIPVYNSYKVSYIANHKGRCLMYVSTNADVPCVPLKAVIEPGDVIKPVSGHGGMGVRRVRSEAEAEALGQRLWTPDSVAEGEAGRTVDEDASACICQPFIEGPCEDVRVYVIGERIAAAVKRVAPDGEFRANASLGAAVFPYELRECERTYAERIIRLFSFGMVGIDFIIDRDGQFLFSEIEDVVGARMLYRTHPEIDILREYLMYLTMDCEVRFLS